MVDLEAPASGPLLTGSSLLAAPSKAREDDERYQESRQEWPDQIMLQQCLLWFYMKFNKKYGIMETINQVPSDPNYMEFVFEVIDTGKGIPKDKQVSVFENYIQVNKTTPKHEGTGLGLGIETAPEHEGTGLGLGIVQSLVMRIQICMVDLEAPASDPLLTGSSLLAAPSKAREDGERHQESRQERPDQIMLQQCLLWFYMKFNKKYGIMETINQVPSDPNYMKFVFEVIDTGKGIPKDKQVSVFENYIQVNETTPKHEGTGLGLGIETAPEHEGTGLGLGIVQYLVMRIQICVSSNKNAKR
nr:histidine kinase CKI1-like [Tanacetum cinerariifolium]